MNVLSLFDGMSCGRISLERAGIKVDNYFASEIDKYAIKVSEHNYHDIIRLGDVKKWREWDLPKIDLIIGGSPCQGFSFAGKKLNFDDPRSMLFFEFESIVKFYNPKHFMLENVRMKKESIDIITERLGVNPLEINSNLLSAQHRDRLYWTNISNVKQPKDKNIDVQSILEWPGYPAARRGRYVDGGGTKQFIEFRKDNKSNCLTTVAKDNVIAKEKYDSRVLDTDVEWRYLTPLEYERLQTVPEGFTSCVSDHQRKRMLGNGWTVDVISHILKGLKGV